jgi:transposase-like protein
MSNKTNRRALSPYKEGFCPFCHIEIEFGLSHRRGDVLIECPECKKTFTINDLENFMKTVSDIEEGDCPNCSTTLIFTVSERVPDASIHCSECKENFFLDEVENPVEKVDRAEITCNWCHKIMFVRRSSLVQTSKAFPSFQCIYCNKTFQKAPTTSSSIHSRVDSSLAQSQQQVQDSGKITSKSKKETKENQRYNPVAVASVPASLILPPIGLALGCVAKKEMKRNNEKGEGLSNIAIAIGIIWVLVMLALVGMALS